MRPDTTTQRLACAERRVQLLEELTADKLRELGQLNDDLRVANADLESTQELMPSALIIVDGVGRIVRVNRITVEISGRERTELDGAGIDLVWPAFAAPATTELDQREAVWRDRQGAEIPMLVSLRRSGFHTVCMGLDLRDRHREEEARRRAQKLESLGQLSAGIAHELNTPMQFISDNVHLLKKGFEGVRVLIDRLSEVHAAAIAGEVPTALLDGVLEAQRDARWAYFATRIDRAFVRAEDGVQRVTQIVGAMKVFSHPQNHLAPVDINRALETTLVVATPELRHVARVTTELGALPTVMGYPDDLNQVFLNLLVNAAHAITDAGRPERGTIALRTRASATHAEIEIADSGCGIPEAIRERVYDPFFTTKAPGRGTGQGLALAHAVIVGRHGGAIHFDTGPSGTTFHIAIPFLPPTQKENHA